MVLANLLLCLFFSQAVSVDAPSNASYPETKQAIQPENPVSPKPTTNSQQLIAPPIIANQYNYPSEKKKETVPKDAWDKSSVIFSGLLVLVGLVGTWFALRSLRAIERQTTAALDSANAAKTSAEVAVESLAHMQSTAETQLRAYVCLESSTLRFPQPGMPEAIIEFKNCGQTPAYDVAGWIHTWFAAFPLTEVLPVAPFDLKKGTQTLSPGRKSIYITPTKPPITEPDLPALGTAKFTMYIYGEVTYKDIFGKVRSTRYRLLHGGSEPNRKGIGKDGKETWFLKPDISGNETT